MGIRISDLIQKERTIVIPIDEEELNLVYSPQAFTPLVEDEMQTLIESRRPGNGLAKMLSKQVVAWDVVDEDGEILEPSFENMKKFPVEFLSLIIGEISADNRVSAEERKNSGGGSQRKGKSEKGRSGSF